MVHHHDMFPSGFLHRDRLLSRFLHELIKSVFYFLR